MEIISKHTCMVKTRSVRVAEWLALPNSDHKIPFPNPVGGGLLHRTFHYTLLSSRYDFDNVERDVIHKIIIIIIIIIIIRGLTWLFLEYFIWLGDVGDINSLNLFIAVKWVLFRVVRTGTSKKYTKAKGYI